MDTLAKELHVKREKSNWFCGYTENWSTYDSPIEDYDKTFSSVLAGRHIVDLVKDRPEPVVVDLMSSTEALVTLFKQLSQQNKLGISVSLEDVRRKEKINEDESLGIKHLVGDLNMSLTWKNLKGELMGRKADLIVSRSGMGVHALLPINEKFYSYVFNRLWENVSEDKGVVLLQSPLTNALEKMGIRVNEWVDMLKANGVEAVFNRGEGDDIVPDYAKIKLVRTPQSPKSLPSLK